MAYYDALIAKWPSVSGGNVAAKLVSLNATMVAGPNQDVAVGAVEAYLGLRGILAAMEDWLGSVSTPGTARTAARELLRTIGSPHVSVFQMSDATTYATISGMLSALAALSPPLLSAQNVSDLLAMAATQVSWAQANGYPTPIDVNMVAAAGLS